MIILISNERKLKGRQVTWLNQELQNFITNSYFFMALVVPETRRGRLGAMKDITYHVREVRKASNSAKLYCKA